MFGNHIITRAATIFVILLAGAGTAAAAGGPSLTAGTGCSVQCIRTALVKATASSATVEIRTTVRTRVVLTARRLSTTGVLVAGPPDASASGHLLRKNRTLFLLGLQPQTTYRIFLSTTDADGHTDSRHGTFKTRAVATNVQPGAGNFSSGLGCSAQCIQKVVPVAIGPTAAVFEFGTDTPARMQLVVSRDAAGHDVASSSSSPGYVTKWTGGASVLAPGTKYFLTIRATDASGRTTLRSWSFRTDEQHVRVTLWKIKIINDGDKGRARGELQFSYWAGGGWLDGESDFHKRSSGDVLTVHAEGTSRPGLTAVFPANGRAPKLDLRVHGEECDGPARIKNCVSEAMDPSWTPTGGGDNSGGNDFAVAGGLLPLSSLLTAGALPPNFGMSMPEGHDGYFAFETTEHHLKFRVYAYLDVFYG
jgi:hypothetical protein